MTTQNRKFNRKERANIAREQIDYVRFCKLVDPESGDLTPQDREWMSSKSVRYLALLLALEDCYKNFTIRGIRQGDHSIDWWEGWLRTLSEDELNNEISRIRVKIENEICPWLDQLKGIA